MTVKTCKVEVHGMPVLLITTFLLIRFTWLYTLIERDEGAFGYISMMWLHGLIPYVNSLDNKGPVLYLIYAIPTLFMKDNPIVGIRIINNIFFVLSSYILYLISLNLFRDKAIATTTTILYGIYMNIPTYEGILAMSESLSAPFFLLSIYFLICKGYRQDFKSSYQEERYFILSGISASIAALIRPIHVLLIVLLFLYLLISSFQKRIKFNAYLFTLIGILIPVLPVLLYFYFNNALDDMFNVLFFRQFERFVYTTRDVPLTLKIILVIVGLPLLIFSSIGIIILQLINRVEKQHIMFLTTWFSLYLSEIIFMKPRHGHRIIDFLPILVVLSALSIHTLYRKFSRRKKVLTRLFVFLIILMFIPCSYFYIIQFPNLNLTLGDFKWRYADFNSYEEQLELAYYIKTSTQPNDTIFVYGWASEVYWLSGKLAPTKWVWSRPENTMPSYEKERLLNLIRDKYFALIVLIVGGSKEYLVDLARKDEFVNYTIRLYEYVRSFGPAHVFKKTVQKIMVNETCMYCKFSTEELTLCTCNRYPNTKNLSREEAYLKTTEFIVLQLQINKQNQRRCSNLLT
ncbi:MAG: glycosyltransferase family 39 protein [Candidatus Odinarchaeota archaeon]|nr:glycosyltransferase family 39 protein [Candidatus Odinarchaeota archaeon]